MSISTEKGCFIHGIGVAVPDRSLSCHESADLFQQATPNSRSARLLARVARLTGIEKRHLAALNQQGENLGAEKLYLPVSEQPHGPGMSARTRAFEREAAPLVLRAISELPVEALSAVQTLVTVSCTHASSPGLELPILTCTPIPGTVHRWNLGFMGCSAGLAAIRLVHQLSAGEALIAACELSSLHFQYTDQVDQMTANLLFGDGAAVMLLSNRFSPVRVVACRSFSLPAMADQMVWWAGDHGLQLRLSQELPDTIASNLPSALGAFLDQTGMSKRAIDHWLVHPGGPQILDAVENSLQLPVDSLIFSRNVFRRFGNMSSSTIFFILKEVLAAGVVGNAVAMAFGPGLTIELMLLRIDNTAAHDPLER